MRELYEELDTTLYPMMPDPGDRREGGYYLFQHEQLRGYLLMNPRGIHEDGYLAFPYALCVFDEDGRHLFTAAVEQTDYRALSSLTRTPLKELTGGQRKPYSDPQLALYSAAGGHEVFQNVEEPYTRQEAVTLLLDVVLDVLDSLSDPEFVDNPGTLP